MLIRNGHYREKVLRREGLSRAEVDAALRRQNADGPQQVAQATLNPGGVLLVDLKPEEQNATRGDVARLAAKLDRLLADR